MKHFDVYIFVQQISNHNMIDAERANVCMPKSVMHIPGTSRIFKAYVHTKSTTSR